MPITRPTLTNLNSVTSQFDDTVIVLNATKNVLKGTGARPEQGIIFNRPSTPSVDNVAIIWNETSQAFTFITTANTDSTSGNLTVSGNANVTTGNVIVNGNISSLSTITVMSNTAPVSGGGSGITLGNAALGIYFGSGAPTISAAQGSLYMRTDGTGTSDRMYVNTNGTTGWTNLVTAT